MEPLNETAGTTGEIAQVVDLQIEQIELPEDLINIVDVEILQWLVSRNFSEAIVESAAARCRIQVAKKPRCKTQRYIVVSGIIPFLILLGVSKSVSVRVVVVEEAAANVPQLINDDLVLWLFAFKAGATASAGKASLLMSLMHSREISKQSSGFVLTSRQLSKGGLLKALTGHDPRGFKREKIDPVPPVLASICEALGIKHDALTRQSDDEDEV